MRKTFLISGARAACYRLPITVKVKQAEAQQPSAGVNARRPLQLTRISRDLLNPDIHVDDRAGYFCAGTKFKSGRTFVYQRPRVCFEKKLGDNSGGLLNIQLKDMADDEREAGVPLIFFNSVIKATVEK